MRKTLYIILFAFILPLSVNAQTFMMQDFAKERVTLNFRYLHPDYDLFTISPFAGIYDFKLNYPISRKLDLVTSLPLVVFNRKSTQTYYFGSDGNALGNWYLGIQSRSSLDSKSYSSFSFGVFLPTSSDKDYAPLYFASTTDFHENYRYNPHQLAIYGNFSQRYLYEDGVSLTWEFGPQIYIPTQNNTNDGMLYLHYGISGSIESDRFYGTAELVGTADVTHKYEYIDYRFMHFLSIGAGFNGPVFSPSIFYQFPVDKKGWYGLPNSTFGLKVAVQFQ